MKAADVFLVLIAQFLYVPDYVDVWQSVEVTERRLSPEGLMMGDCEDCARLAGCRWCLL